MGKHSLTTNPDGISPAPLVDAGRARSRRNHPAGRRLLTAGALAVGIVAAGTGVASAAPSQASTDAHARYNHADLGPQPEPCGIQCEAPKINQADEDAASGAAAFGIPAIFVIGLILAF
jgi:hypothetical protein